MKMLPFLPDEIAETVAAYYSVSVDALRSRSRTRHVSEARTVAMYLTRELVRSSFSEIGAHYSRGHEMALYAYGAAKNRMESDAAFREIVAAIEENLHQDDPRKQDRGQFSPDQ